MPVAELPDFPWDSLAAAKAKAGSHPDGIVDLSVGTPVDSTPRVLQDALIAAADAPGYPQVWGTPDLRDAVAGWFARRRNASDVDPDSVMPVIGTKEFVAWLPTLLGLGVGTSVGIPELAYPTYDVGARIAGATPRAAASLLQFGPMAPKLLWINTPANPHGQVLPVDHLKKVVAWARQRGVIVASDECYAELDWRRDDAKAAERATSPRGGVAHNKLSEGSGAAELATPGAVPSWREEPDGLTTPSILDDRICGGSHEGLLAVYSLSKQSNLAGYRAGFVAGDTDLVQRLVQVRKHAGMIVPWPVQRVIRAAVQDDEHVALQKKTYAARRDELKTALLQADWRIDYSEAGLYLWATQGKPCRESIDDLAQRGILAAPGDFYGAAGAQHVRIALTATDERISAAAKRLTS